MECVGAFTLIKLTYQTSGTTRSERLVRSEDKGNYRIQFQNLNGIKEYTILICIYLNPDYAFLDPREICANLDDTLFKCTQGK
jgi:hypothetical protein